MIKIYTPQELEAQYEKLSGILQDAMFDADIADRMYALGKSQSISVDKLKIISAETGNIILGLVTPKDFIPRISERTGIPPEKTKIIARDIFKDILLPLKDEIKRVHGFEITEEALEGEPTKPTVPIPPLPRKPEPVVIPPRPQQPSAPLPPRSPFQPSQTPQQTAPIPRPPVVIQKPPAVPPAQAPKETPFPPQPTQPASKPPEPPLQKPPQTPITLTIPQRNVILPEQSKQPIPQESIAPPERIRPLIPPAPPPPGMPKNIVMPGMPQKMEAKPFEQKPAAPPREVQTPKPFIPPIQPSAPQQKIFVSPKPPVLPRTGGDPYRETVKPDEKEIPQKRDQVPDPRGPRPPFVPRKPTVPYVNPKIPPINLRDGQQQQAPAQKPQPDPYREEIE